MMYFRSSKSINKRLTFSLFMIIVFAIGVFIFLGNKNVFTNYKTYYLQSYSYIIPYKIKEIFDLTKPSHVSGLTSSSSPYTESIPVLLYHGVLGGNPNNSEGEATNIDLATFWDQMKTLKEAGWKTVTMQDFYDFKKGLKKLPAKSFMITFDDGRKDSYYPSDPILKTLGFHAVMFVIDKYSLEEKSNYYLSKDELSKMARSPNWELESHGYSSHSIYPIDSNGTLGHFFSNKLWIANEGRVETTDEFIVRSTQDLQESKNNLTEAFKKPITAFAFPFGDYGFGNINFPNAEQTLVPEVLNVYPLAFYQYSSNYRYSQNYQEPENISGKFMIKRIGIGGEWTGKQLLSIFEKGDEKNLPYNATFTEGDGWVNTDWGIMTLQEGKMDLSALKDNTGSTVVLDGTNAWTDYMVTANIRWIKGSNVYLASRYKDDNNVAFCNFKKDLVHVEQTIDGVTRVIAGEKNVFDPGSGISTISMKVNGRRVECSINGNVIVSTDFLDSSLQHGGVGIKAWDSLLGNSDIEINKFSVTNL